MSHVTEVSLLPKLAEAMAEVLGIDPASIEFVTEQATKNGEAAATHKEENTMTLPNSFIIEGVTLELPTGPLDRVLSKSERRPLNSALTKCGQETLGAGPTVELALGAYRALYNRVNLGKATGSVPRMGKHRKAGPAVEKPDYVGKHRKGAKQKVATYIPVDRPLTWKGQPVSQKQYDHYTKMSKWATKHNAERAAKVEQSDFEAQVAEITMAVVAALS